MTDSINLESDLEKDYKFVSQNNIESVRLEDKLKQWDQLNRQAANETSFFRQLFVLEKVFSSDYTQIIPANTITSDQISALTFVWNTRRVQQVLIDGYLLKSSWIYMFSMNMPIQITAGVERIELLLNITPKVGASYSIKVYDISVWSSHTLLDEIFNYYTIIGTKMIEVGSWAAITFSAIYHNSWNASPGTIIYKEGGTRDLHLITQ